jgi:hypothetical protein
MEEMLRHLGLLIEHNGWESDEWEKVIMSNTLNMLQPAKCTFV